MGAEDRQTDRQHDGRDATREKLRHRRQERRAADDQRKPIDERRGERPAADQCPDRPQRQIGGHAPKTELDLWHSPIPPRCNLSAAVSDFKHGSVRPARWRAIPPGCGRTRARACGRPGIRRRAGTPKSEPATSRSCFLTHASRRCQDYMRGNFPRSACAYRVRTIKSVSLPVSGPSP